MSSLRLFNLDLHISVIEDIKDICVRLFGNKIEITNWSLSEHNWVFKKDSPNIFAVNQNTWRGFNETMIQEFQAIYDDYLKEYDGFIVTHTPVFSMLFEKYNKPILCVNTCRYDQPFCWTKDERMRKLFHESLHRMTSKGQLTIVSNNAADYKYLLKHTGIVSKILPSLCLYTNSKYSPKKTSFVIYGDKEVFPNHPLLSPRPSQGYSWSDLFEYKGIVHSPYEMSTMSIFEQLWAGVPLFFPTKRFYKESMIKGTMQFISPYREWNSLTLADEEVEEWLSLADFYVYPVFYYYDSMEELVQKLETFEDEKKEERMKWLAATQQEILERWRIILKSIFFSL